MLDLSSANDPIGRPQLLERLRRTLFDTGFLYVWNHGVPDAITERLAGLLPALFALPNEEKARLSKLNSPHFLGYSGYAEETTLGKQDLREQFYMATELRVVYQEPNGDPRSLVEGRDHAQLYWRLRGPNQWPDLPGFQEALIAYHDALQELSYRFVHLIEEAFAIPIGTFDHFFGQQSSHDSPREGMTTPRHGSAHEYLPPQHRIKLLRYPPSPTGQSQGVGAHKDSSGWLTFLFQVGDEAGLEVLASNGRDWFPAPPVRAPLSLISGTPSRPLQREL
ncbi:hypothetical protein LTR53_017752 [Teratosphaeriaceae sp. CCFEE 6253]|nr:hypothetical protein LTR53_017752 [Teratosphaeriaceae sp. CCFEE 6253]